VQAVHTLALKFSGYTSKAELVKLLEHSIDKELE